MMFKFFLLLVFSIGFLSSFASKNNEFEPKSDTEIWNEGVDYYRSGDVTNALSALRPLMLSRTHGARAAEVVAKLEYDAALKLGATNVLRHLEEAAVASQMALRANPTDKRLNDNFTLAIAEIPRLREEERIQKLLASGSNKNPVQLLKESVIKSRKIIAELEEIKLAYTNDADKVIALADDLGSRGEKLADNWIILKEAIVQSVTNENELAQITKAVDDLHAKTLEAAHLISDVDMASAYGFAAAEGGFTEFYKGAVQPPEAMDTVILNQSNACMNVATECDRSWQKEALDYTRAFRARFPGWAKNYERECAANTNKPPFTVEMQAKIADLATRLEKSQIECVENPVLATQQNALNMAIEISNLLPKDNNSKNQNNNDQNQQQNNKNDKNNNDQNKDQNSQDNNPSENENNESQDNAENEEKEDKKSSQSKDSQEQKEIEAILKRAQERSDEHEAEKKARMRSMRLPANERDW